MTSKERFHFACSRRQPDRVPVDYLATRDAHERIMRHFDLGGERDLLDLLGADLYHLSARDISQNEGFAKIYRGPALYADEEERVCPLGIRYRRAVGDWKFGADEAIEGALEGAESPGDVLRHSWPKPSWFDPEPLLEECESFSDRVIVGGFWTAILGNAVRLHGFENFLMNLALKPGLIRTLIDRLTDFYLELNERLFSCLKGRIDVYYFGNDFGSQSGLLFSEQMWLDFYYRSYTSLVSLAKRYGLKVMVHSCGAIVPLLEHFVDVGIDIVDPVQTTAEGMDPGRLKREFGSRLVFHGALDTQHVLPAGTRDEIVSHAAGLIDVLGAGGGYIFAPCNNLQADTPVESIEAAYRVAGKRSGRT